MAEINPMVDDIEIQLSDGSGCMINMIDADLIGCRWRPLRRGNTSYARGSIPRGDGEKLLHRIILERMLGRPIQKGEVVDHIDGNGLNNCRNNLRLASPMQNAGNSTRKSKNKPYKGVYFHKKLGLYQARLRIDGKVNKSLGCFDTAEEAHEAYKRAAIEKWGEFARF